MNQYDKQAQDFADKHNVKLSILNVEHKSYEPLDDKECSRDVYTLKLSRGRKSHTFTFGQSIINSLKGIQPTMYDVLSCLTQYDPEDFECFCSNYGYNNDSISALKTYKSVCKEWKATEKLFGDVLDELREIQ